MEAIVSHSCATENNRNNQVLQPGEQNRTNISCDSINSHWEFTIRSLDTRGQLRAETEKTMFEQVQVWANIFEQ